MNKYFKSHPATKETTTIRKYKSSDPGEFETYGFHLREVTLARPQNEDMSFQ
jgi:hypothetical protein